MKKLLLILSVTMLSIGVKAQTTATDFTANDCNSVSHNLFNELNSGKVVILAWVMPCGSCVSACQMAWNIANSYSVSNPGQVVFYIADDFGTTSCMTLNNWITTNTITPTALFTNSVISMSDYGASGMPKVVVLAGASTHSVYYNQNNASITSPAIQNAVTNALNDAGATGIKEVVSKNFGTKIQPNPVTNELNLLFNSKENSTMQIDIYNAIGQKVKSVEVTTSNGINETTINVESLSNGNYFAKISNGKNEDVIKFIINH